LGFYRRAEWGGVVGARLASGFARSADMAAIFALAGMNAAIKACEFNRSKNVYIWCQELQPSKATAAN